jgi:hypothetical protein
MLDVRSLRVQLLLVLLLVRVEDCSNKWQWNMYSNRYCSVYIFCENFIQNFYIATLLNAWCRSIKFIFAGCLCYGLSRTFQTDEVRHF